MPRRPPNSNSIANVKARVRARDGMRCTGCGMTNAAHLAATGKQLQVHRLVPGSLYTEGGCRTLCHACHKGQPKRARGSVDHARPHLCRVEFQAPPGWLDAVSQAAAALTMPVSAYVRLACNRQMQADRIHKEGE